MEAESRGEVLLAWPCVTYLEGHMCAVLTESGRIGRAVCEQLLIIRSMQRAPQDPKLEKRMVVATLENTDMCAR